MRRFASVILAGALGLLLMANDAARAQSCRALEAELDHLRATGGGTSRDRTRYERAFREQARVLAHAEAQARSAGCFGGGFLFFRRDVERACRGLVFRMREMQDNLARLDRLRRQGGGSPRRIRALERAIAERGCGLPREERWAARPERREPVEPFSPYSVAPSTFRTLCVRTCDGYYFPISFATTQDRFGTDAMTCSAMCPGAEARLFFHPNPGGGPQDMLSIDGQPYSSLPTAFQYRTSLSPSCTCKPAGGYSPVPVAAPSAAAAQPAEPMASLPQPRPAPGEDPETLANRGGGFVPRPLSEGAAVAAAANERRVRIVGPAYWGAPEQQGVILTPVPN